MSYNGVLKALSDMDRSGKIKEAAIISRDGTLIKAIPGNTSRNNFAVMVANILGASETALSEIGIGCPERIIVEAGEDRIIMKGAGPKMFLSVIIEKEANIGHVLLAMEKAAENIKLLSK